MKINQNIYKQNQWQAEMKTNENVDWVLIFGEVQETKLLKSIKEYFPNALLTGCTTAGEIYQENVHDNLLTITTIEFERGTSVKGRFFEVMSSDDSFKVGQSLANELMSKDLSHVFILSEGLNINGSELTDGLVETLPENVLITGGLSGDNGVFKKTFQYYNENIISNAVIAIGLYGNDIKIGHGSVGGWKAFGPERIATKSKGNCLYELDGQPALDLYKKYLGEHAEGLPASGLRFPLKISGPGVQGSELVRTILGICEESGSLIFAGDIPQGCIAQLMMSNCEGLVEGAQLAAATSLKSEQNSKPELAILISCVGRKLFLQQRVEEEIEVVREVLGEKVFLTGFYSYGEICPAIPYQGALHNQTMTITTLSEG